MIAALQNDKWLGYAALFAVALITIASRFSVGSEPVRAVVGISLMVFGVYCAIRGVFVGNIPSRICAGLSLVFWSFIAYLLFAAITHARIR